MKTNVFFSWFIVVFSLTNFCYGQEWPDEGIKKFIEKTPFVFEGIVIKSQTYKCKGSICNSNIVKITKIFKGTDSLSYGTIDVVTEGGQWGNEIVLILNSGYKRGNLSGESIFFCVPSKFSSSELTVDNKIRVMPSEIILEFFDTTGWADGFGRIFRSKKEIYDFLSKHLNSTIPRE